MMIVREPLILIVGLSFLAACSSDASPAEGSDFHVDAVPLLTLEETLRIGSVEDPDYGFSRINGVDVDQDGQIYVYEAQDGEIRVYSPEGERLRTIGRRGAGPGEFQGIVVFDVVGDTVWTFSTTSPMEPGRVSLFTRAGRTLNTASAERVPVRAIGGCGLVLPTRVTEDHLYLGDFWLGYMFTGCPAPVNAVDSLAAASDSARVHRVLFDATGQVVDTASSYSRYLPARDPKIVEVGSSQYELPSAPRSESQQRIQLLDGEFVIEYSDPESADDGRMRLTRLDFAGDTVASQSLRYIAIEYPESMLDSIAARSARSLTRPLAVLRPDGTILTMERHPADSAAAHAAIRGALQYPRYQSPFSDTHIGDDGALWLRLITSDRQLSHWLLLDPSGEPRGRVELPHSGIQPAWSRDDTIIAIERDEFDVPWLIRYQIQPTLDRGPP